MAEIILPQIQEPGVSVDQTILNAGAQTSVDAPQPGVVVGVKNVVIDDAKLVDSYTGSVHNYPLPDFEAGFKVYEDSSLKPVLENVAVGVLGAPVMESGTVTTSGDQTFLNSATSGKLKGVVRGDKVTVEKAVSSGVAGSVVISSTNVLTEVGAMANVIPGDILVVGSNEFEILLVTNDTVTVEGVLAIGNAVTWSVIRRVQTNVLSTGVTDTNASQVELDSDISAGSVSFKIERDLVIGGTVNGDQPLSTNISLVSPQYSIVDGANTKDTLQIAASLAVDGFSNFNEVLNNASGTIATNVITILGDLTSNTPRLAAGGVIFFNDDSNNKYSRTVVSVAANGGDTDVTFDGAALTAAVTSKPVRSVYKTLTTPVGGTGYTYSSAASLDIIEAKVSVSYKARATADVYTVVKIATIADLDKLGAKIPENYIRVAAEIAKVNAGDNAVYAIMIPDESLASYARGYETAEGILLYSVVPLTQSFSNVSASKSHVDSMSTATKCKWRVGFINLKRPVEDFVVVPAKSGVLNVVGVNAGGTTGTITLTDTKANFADVRIGQYLKVRQQDGVISTIPGPDAISQAFVDGNGNTKYMRIYKVIEVINSNKIKVAVLPYSGSTGAYVQATSTVAEANQTYVVTYEVIKVLNADEQSQAMGHIGQSFSDRRINYVPNESCIIEFTKPDGTVYDVEMPGFMICAALAGVVSATFPHQPMTRVPLAGIKGVRGGKEMFNSDQLSVQATGGCWIVVQDELDVSSPYTWRQITTSQGGLKEQEFSFTKNLDEICYALYFDHQRFPGRNNRVPRTLAAIEAQTRATLEGRKTTERNSITGGFLGTQIIDYQLSGVIEDPLLLDTVYSDITLELPLPLNSIRFRVAA